MNRLLEFHRFFHWFYYTKQKSNYFQIGLGCFIWFFLSLTQPFGIYDNNLPNFWFLIAFLLPFGILASLIFFLTDKVIIQIYGDGITKNNYNDLVFMVIKVILVIHVFVFFRIWLSSRTCLTWLEYFEMWLAMGIMFTIYYIPFALYAKYKYFKEMVGFDKAAAREFVLKGNGKKLVQVDLDRIIYFSSADNYVDIYISRDNNVERLLFRVTLKSLAEQLKAYPQFLRIHRSYIVNLRFLSGKPEKQSLLLKDRNFSLRLPISGKYTDRMKQIIA